MISPEDKLPALMLPRLRDGHAEAAVFLEAAMQHVDQLCPVDPLQLECGPQGLVDGCLAVHTCRCSRQLRHTSAGQRNSSHAIWPGGVVIWGYECEPVPSHGASQAETGKSSCVTCLMPSIKAIAEQAQQWREAGEGTRPVLSMHMLGTCLQQPGLVDQQDGPVLAGAVTQHQRLLKGRQIAHQARTAL